ncbi:MAG: hypothetical protein JNL24_00745 [Bacteroidia bacterium]|nr:hypothetical protein [Bacteroidia bacterium]
MKNKVKYVLLVLVCFCYSFLSAQVYKDSLVTDRINTLSGFWNKYNSISAPNKNYESIAVVPSFYTLKTENTSSLTDPQANVYDAHIQQLKRDVGLAATGNYQENFAPGFGADDDLIYNRRFQAGLDWNVLGDGYLSNRYKRQVIENQKTINGLKPQVKISAADYIAISHQIIYSFNEQKIALLDKRQAIINDKIDVANELYLMKQLPKLDLMQIIQQQVDVSSMYQIYRSYNEQLKLQNTQQLSAGKLLPVFDIDFEKINGASDSKLADSILQLQMENIELQNKLITDINLKTQLRYNYYDLISASNPNRSFMSAGLNLSIPLPLSIHANKNVVEAEKQLLLYEQKNAAQQKDRDVLNSIYEYRYKLKQYNNFIEKRKKYEELIRIERVKQKLEDLEFNPVTALNLLDELLSVDIELVDLQQEMYLQLLDIITKNPGIDILSVIKPHQLPETKLQSSARQQSMYIWSAAFDKYDAAYVEEYLRMNKINTAIVSIKKGEKDKAFYNSLFEKLKKNAINVELLIGSNKLLTSKDPSVYFDSIFSGLDDAAISSIHLDVEPHVLDDWQTNKEKYLNQYVELLTKAKQYADAKKVKLSVSIPVFYPEEILKQIYPLCSQVYIMAYEHPQADFIARKVKEEMAISSQKTIVAIRSKDFKDRKQLEGVLNELSQMLNTNQFALHDFESFVLFDEQAVGGNK